MRELRMSERRVAVAVLAAVFASTAGTASAQRILFTAQPPLALNPMPQILSAAADVGDVDGDGYAELLLGAPTCCSTGQGAAFLHRGGSSPWPLRTYTTTAPYGSYSFGRAVSGVGDVDGDGIPDFAIGDDPVDGGIYSFTKGKLIGWNFSFIAPLDDVDGDGVPDIVVEARDAQNQPFLQIVSLGKQVVLRSAAVQWSSGVSTQSIAKVSDFDGDGLSDFVEFAWGSAVVRSSRDLSVVTQPGSSLVYASAVVGDVDGDGLDDFIFASAGFGAGTGRIEIVSSKTWRTLLTVTGTPPTPIRGGSELGRSVMGLGDVDHDGYTEFAATDDFGVNVYTARDGTLLATIPALNARLLLGGADFDGDGQGDLVVAIDGSPSIVNVYGKLADAFAYYKTVGSGCLGSTGLATLAAAAPHVGKAFTATVANLPAGAPVSMLLGLSNTSLGGIPLPLSLSFIGMPGCTLYTSGDLAFPLFNVGGQASWSFVPQPFSIGVSFWTQAVVWDPQANPLGLVLSDAAEGRVGI